MRKIFEKKLQAIGLRLFHLLYFLPSRVKRILSHFQLGIRTVSTPGRPLSWIAWTTDLGYLTLDFFGMGELLEIGQELFKWNLHCLRPADHEIALIFLKKKHLADRIRIDSKAFFGPKTHSIAYVGFTTINSWGILPRPVLVHEIIHVWQFYEFGMAYISKALRAQRSQYGYHYGGTSYLEKALKNGKRFRDFNFEQQASIVEDYFRIASGLQPKFGEGKIRDLPVYLSILEQDFPGLNQYEF